MKRIDIENLAKNIDIIDKLVSNESIVVYKGKSPIAVIVNYEKYRDNLPPGREAIEFDNIEFINEIGDK